MKTRLAGSALLLIIAQLLAAPPVIAAIDCANGEPIDVTLSGGTRWEMCWRNDEHTGIDLSSIYVTLPETPRRRVLRSASIAQIHQAYDDNVEVISHVTRIGLGGNRLKTLGDADCPAAGRLTIDDRAVLCKRILGRGIAYKYQNTSVSGELLELFSVSRTGRATFVVRWHFHDSGTIVPSVGIGGKLKHYSVDARYGWPLVSGDIYAVGSTFNIFWRLDFAIGAHGNDDVVEQIEARPSNTRLSKVVSINLIGEEASLRTSSKNKRSWRVRDSAERNADAIDGRGHGVSYQLDPLTNGHRYTGPASEPWSNYDLFVTSRRNCERFATDNAHINPNCGDSVVDYVNGDRVDQAAIVLWYSITRHELPASEDNPIKPIEWNSFQLLPRDWSPRNPLTGQRMTPTQSTDESPA